MACSSTPSDFQTYTDEDGWFSISVPPDWEINLTQIPQVKQAAKDVYDSMYANIPVEKTNLLFFAGVRFQTGYMPYVTMVAEPLPDMFISQDKLVEEGINFTKAFIKEYQEFARSRTLIEGSNATIIECAGHYPNQPSFHALYMITKVNGYVWNISCTSTPEDYDKWSDDFRSIVRSLKVHE